MTGEAFIYGLFGVWASGWAVAAVWSAVRRSMWS